MVLLSWLFSPAPDVPVIYMLWSNDGEASLLLHTPMLDQLVSSVMDKVTRTLQLLLPQVASLPLQPQPYAQSAMAPTPSLQVIGQLLLFSM